MANIDRPNGLRAVRQSDGGAICPVNAYTTDASASAIFIGDKVKLEADGNIELAAGGDVAVGVAASVAGDYDDLSRRHALASTANTIMVWDSPDTIFEIQEIDGGTALTSAEVGNLADTTTTGGSTTSGISRQEIDSGTEATGSGSLRLLRLANIENNAYGDNAKWEVTINEHQYRAITGDGVQKMAISTQTSPKLLWPGQREIWGDYFYNRQPSEYDKIFSVVSSDKAFEEMTGITGFGLTPVKSQGASLVFDTEAQGYTQRFTNVSYALGYQVTREELEDNQYKKVTAARNPALARSMRQTIETVCANHLNRAESSSYTWADGVELLSSAHPNVNGGTWVNELATPADLSESSLEDVCILIDKATDDRGLQVQLRAEKLVVHPNDRFTAQRILESDLQSDTANNAKNVVSGMFSGYEVNHYLDDTDAFFVTTDVPQGLVFLERTAADVEQDYDFATKNTLVSGYMRNSSGVVDSRGVYGSKGAAQAVKRQPCLGGAIILRVLKRGQRATKGKLK